MSQSIHSYKCDSCGGTLERVSDIEMLYRCRYCHSEKKVYDWGTEAGRLLEKALMLRLSFAYDIAQDIYLDIIRRHPDCIDAYWGALLSRYGVEISERTQFRPSLHKICSSKFTEEPLYRQFLSHRKIDAVAAIGYRQIAEEIDQVRGEALISVRSQPKYDVFLSFKNEDGHGGLTKDRVYAEKLYKILTKRGYKVFFAPVTLKGKAGLAYEPIIYAALHSATDMIVVASREEYINSPWVANEWKRYKELIVENQKNSGYRNLRLIVCHSDPLSIHTLPDNLSRYQNIDMDDAGSEKLLLSYFEKKTGNTEKPQPKKQEKEPYVPPPQSSSPPVKDITGCLSAVLLLMGPIGWIILYFLQKK